MNVDKGVYDVDGWMQFLLSGIPQSMLVSRETAKRCLDANVNFELIIQENS